MPTTILRAASFSLFFFGLCSCQGMNGDNEPATSEPATNDPSANEPAVGEPSAQPEPEPGCDAAQPQNTCAPTGLTFSFEGTIESPANLEVVASLMVNGVESEIRVQTYANYPPIGETFALGEYILGDLESSFETCGLCILLLVGDDGTGEAEFTKMPLSGKLHIDEISPMLRLRFEDVTFRNVTIEPQTFVTTETDGSCASDIWNCEVSGTSDG